jgi:hypothetical protein
MRIDRDTCRDLDLLAAEVRRLEAVIAAAGLSQKCDCPVPENAARQDKVFPQQNMTAAERAAVGRVTDEDRVVLERLGDTPAANATPGEGSKQDGCTLTDEERHFLERCADASGSAGEAARSILRRFT